MALAILNQLLPLLITHAPQIIGQVKAIFTHPKVGLTDAEFDAALEANQKNIDRLANPDSFRTRRS